MICIYTNEAKCIILHDIKDVVIVINRKLKINTKMFYIGEKFTYDTKKFREHRNVGTIIFHIQ